MQLFRFISTFFAVSRALDNGLGLTPQMGWNSWNKFHCDISETLIQSVAQAIVSSGLKDAGYEYVNLDDCWQSARYPNGTIEADPTKFPSGIQALVDYVHNLGLKFGLYSDAGNKTCQGKPGSWGYETIDANTYAAWGVDYLKYDNCNSGDVIPEDRYPAMRDALNKTGRPIFFSMCEWGVDYPWNWAPNVGNSWRTTGDISDNWDSMIHNWDWNGPASAAGPGGWNDPDMLEVGNGGMTTTEYMTHFSLWAIGKAPLLVGCDVRSMSNDTLAILSNKEVIAINQDKLGIQATIRTNVDVVQTYASKLENDCYAVAMLNRGTDKVSGARLNWGDLDLDVNQSYVIRNLWTHENVATVAGEWMTDIESHQTILVKLTPA